MRNNWKSIHKARKKGVRKDPSTPKVAGIAELKEKLRRKLGIPQKEWKKAR